MSDAELMVFLIMFHSGGFRCVKHYNQKFVCTHLKHLCWQTYYLLILCRAYVITYVVYNLWSVKADCLAALWYWPFYAVVIL